MKFLSDHLAKRIKLPLYKDDGEPFFRLAGKQKEIQAQLNRKIKNGEYAQIQNYCLCANEYSVNDKVLSEKDLFGIGVKNILCCKCGLIRSDKIFDDKSMALFYKNEYNTLYYNLAQPSESFFRSQITRGNGFLSLIEKMRLLDDIETVFEVGCNMGGNIYPFHQKQKSVSGCDYDDEYLRYGNSKGLNLYQGEVNDQITPDNSQDLIILSHVMEHFAKPVNSLNEIAKKIRPRKYLLVEVPGIFADKPYSYYPIWHFQKAHVYNFFYKEYLEVFFSSLGFEILYGDERCTFVLRKGKTHSLMTEPVYDEKLRNYPSRIENYKYSL